MSHPTVEQLQKTINALQQQQRIQAKRYQAAQQTLGELLNNNVELRTGNLMAEEQVKSLTNQLTAANARIADLTPQGVTAADTDNNESDETDE